MERVAKNYDIAAAHKKKAHTLTTECHCNKCIIASAHIHKFSSMTTRMFINLNYFLKYNKSGNNSNAIAVQAHAKQAPQTHTQTHTSECHVNGAIWGGFVPILLFPYIDDIWGIYRNSIKRQVLLIFVKNNNAKRTKRTTTTPNCEQEINKAKMNCQKLITCWVPFVHRTQSI